MKTEYCVECDRPTKHHCRKCGAPLCPICGSNEGICLDCHELEDDDDCREYSKDEL